MKFLLCSAPVLCYPRFDREFILQTDASDFGVGAVLSQIDDNGYEKVVAYASKALSARQKKFSATEKEAYAIVFGTQQFRVYLLGRHFKIVTDHNALRWLHSMEPKGRLARWILDLQEFTFSVVPQLYIVKYQSKISAFQISGLNSIHKTKCKFLLLHRLLWALFDRLIANSMPLYFFIPPTNISSNYWSNVSLGSDGQIIVPKLLRCWVV